MNKKYNYTTLFAVVGIAIGFFVSGNTIYAENHEEKAGKIQNQKDTEVFTLEYEENENQLIEAALLEKADVIKECTITYYCPCYECNRRYDELSANGMKLTPYVTCAVDSSIIPIGSDVLVDFGDGEIHYYKAYDTGVIGDHVDICVSTHDEAMKNGITTAKVYFVSPNKL